MNYKLTNNRIIISKPCDFNPKQTLTCGQIFRYKITEDYCEVNSGENYAKIYENENKIEIVTKTPEYFLEFFDLNRDYSAIRQSLSFDQTVKEALPYGSGIRILKNNLVEIMFSFVISANNNIPRIQKIIEKLCRFGKKCDGYNAFPTIKELNELSLEKFSALGAGYRDKYLFKLSKELANVNLEEKKKLSTKELRTWLISLSGIGPKVADCILLFGFNRFDVFPVDTWVEKLYNQYYFNGEKSRPEIAKFFVDYFGQNAGIAQQYLFNYIRNFDK